MHGSLPYFATSVLCIDWMFEMATPGRASGESQRGPDGRVGLVKELGIKEGVAGEEPVRAPSDSLAEVSSPWPLPGG